MESTEIFDFGMRLRKLREARGFSRSAFAQKLDVSKETIYRYENNIQTPSLDRTKQMAIILRTSIDYLVGLDHIYTIKIPDLSPEQHEALDLFLKAFVSNNNTEN